MPSENKEDIYVRQNKTIISRNRTCTFVKYFCYSSLQFGVDTELASVLTYIEVIKFIRFVSTRTVSTSTRQCHYY